MSLKELCKIKFKKDCYDENKLHQKSQLEGYIDGITQDNKTYSSCSCKKKN